MREHQSRRAGVWYHGSVLGEADANGGEVQYVAQQEVEALVGQGGIAYGGTLAPVVLGKEFLRLEFLIGGISPDLLAHQFVPTFGRGFCQAVGHGLLHKTFHRERHRGGKDAYGAALSVQRWHPVGQAQERRTLLAQERQGVEWGSLLRGCECRRVFHRFRYAVLIKKYVLVAGVCPEQSYAEHRAPPFLGPLAKESHGLLSQVASMLPWDAPGVVEVYPIDIRYKFGNAEREGMHRGESVN